MTEYAYLHCHTIYSIQDAMPTHEDYVNAIYNMNKRDGTNYKCVGFANTDHGNISGFVKHYNACTGGKDASKTTKALYGCEVYMCDDVDNNPNEDRFHLVLIAVTDEGLTNLYQIASHSGLHTIQGRIKRFPVTDIKFMKDHGKGIVCLTACVAGMVPQCIINGNMQKAIDYVKLFDSIFDDVYLEVQPLEIKEQLLANNGMIKLSAQTGKKLVMTTDTHYINKDDKQFHDILKNISHQKPFNTENYLFTPEEMEEYCKKYDIPIECIGNTAEIANMADVHLKPKRHDELLPIFPCPKGYDESSYLRKIVFDKLYEKLVKRNIKNPRKYIEQTLYELDIICSKGFAGYFLILWDWFDWCRRNGILCGPGRGSAAGSIVSYALNITKVDPIENGFVFERFLTKERDEFPDIDTDIPRSKRAEAIRYLLTRYGHDNVSQIITFGKYKLKNTVKGVLSYLGVPYEESNNVTKGVPDLIDGKEVTWSMIEKYHNDPDNGDFSSFSENEKISLSKSYDALQEVFQKYPMAYHAVLKVTGCINTTGIHAGGVIICCKPIKEHAGLIDGGDTAVLPLIQFEMVDMDFYGFLKIDALGLKQLDIIKEAMDLCGLDYDWYDSENFSDQSVYDMLKNGETTDVFQMSSFTPTKMLKDFDVHDIGGMSAVNAGNRPGPLEKDKVTGKSMVDIYKEHVANNDMEDWGNDAVNEILVETKGCIWYQENCINLGKIMAGYSAGTADARIRKTLGKKKVKLIPEIRNEFIYGKKSLYDDDKNVIGMSEENSPYCIGAVNRGYSEELAKKVFASMESFAKYSFNQSHSCCYAVLGYKTAWLSKHYPLEFAVANCTVNDEQEDITATLALAKKRNIPILPPDINHSKMSFSIDNGAIRYGLKAIKGLGTAVLSFIENYRNESPVPFKDFDDFYARIHDSNDPVIQGLIQQLRIASGKASINPVKKDVEQALILSGAFDYCEPNRYKLLNHYIVGIRKENKCKILGKEETMPINEKQWARKIKLALEKEYMGTYISEHPLDAFPYHPFEGCSENEVIQTTGIVVSATMKSTKNGKQYISIKYKAKDDIERTCNMFDTERSEELKNTIRKNSIIIIDGKVSIRYNNINASKIRPVVFKKQSIDTEDLEVEDKTGENKQENVPVSNVPFAPIF